MSIQIKKKYSCNCGKYECDGRTSMYYHIKKTNKDICKSTFTRGRPPKQAAENLDKKEIQNERARQYR